jgi:2-iminobutanoate/2-iminopropanoate deaminase
MQQQAIFLLIDHPKSEKERAFLSNTPSKGGFTLSIAPVQTSHAPAAIGPYSQAIVSEPFVFVSGQLGLIPSTGDLAGPDITHQATQALENLRQILLASGSDLNHVLSVDVYLTDMGNFSTFNGIYQRFFSSHRPARAVVEVSALPKGGCVEIKCMAVRNSALEPGMQALCG